MGQGAFVGCAGWVAEQGSWILRAQGHGLGEWGLTRRMSSFEGSGATENSMVSFWKTLVSNMIGPTCGASRGQSPPPQDATRVRMKCAEARPIRVSHLGRADRRTERELRRSVAGREPTGRHR